MQYIPDSIRNIVPCNLSLGYLMDLKHGSITVFYYSYFNSKTELLNLISWHSHSCVELDIWKWLSWMVLVWVLSGGDAGWDFNNQKAMLELRSPPLKWLFPRLTVQHWHSWDHEQTPSLPSWWQEPSAPRHLGCSTWLLFCLHSMTAAFLQPASGANWESWPSHPLPLLSGTITPFSICLDEWLSQLKRRIQESSHCPTVNVICTSFNFISWNNPYYMVNQSLNHLYLPALWSSMSWCKSSPAGVGTIPCF